MSKVPNRVHEHEWRIIHSSIRSKYEFYCIHCLELTERKIP